MDDLVAKADKKVLTEAISFAKNRKLKGSKGDWDEYSRSVTINGALVDRFINVHKYPKDVMISFLKTFDKEGDLEKFAKFSPFQSKRKGLKVKHEQKQVCSTPKLPQHSTKFFCPSNDKVSEKEMSRLLIYKIPAAVSSEELLHIMPGDFTIETERPTDALGAEYCAWAVFKNSREAFQAFEVTEGDKETDVTGRSEKLVKLQCSEGKTYNICIGKMAHGGRVGGALSRKRAAEVKEASVVSKKPKTEHVTRVPEASISVEKTNWQEVKKGEEPELLKKFKSILRQHAAAYNAMLDPNFVKP